MIVNESLDAHVVNPINESIGDISILEIRFRSMKTEKGVINAIYKLTNPYTSKLYRDEYWQGVKDILDTLKSTGGDIEVNVPNGGYVNNSDGGQSKIYDVTYNLNTDSGEVFNLHIRITAHQAGTVQDPWSAYDLTLTM